MENKMTSLLKFTEECIPAEPFTTCKHKHLQHNSEEYNILFFQHLYIVPQAVRLGLLF